MGREDQLPSGHGGFRRWRLPVATAFARPPFSMAPPATVAIVCSSSSASDSSTGDSLAMAAFGDNGSNHLRSSSVPGSTTVNGFFVSPMTLRGYKQQIWVFFGSPTTLRQSTGGE
ncbi:hypothetical protein L2E82_28770 [Cichorium intybus]|uniref:Uncharacterized protein n=1 Tax=Cichorium intybus TaxID=13427 RepID=A0ACB9CWI1_CICIN|nr:hypothetical protein L2E82_28770 [Cichorium intybus]